MSAESAPPSAAPVPPPALSVDAFYEELVALQRTGSAFVAVTLVEALGSTPQDTGAKMLVTAAGRHAGTIGGGRLEAQAIAHAQRFLAAPAPAAGHAPSAPPARFVAWTLKTDVGMTCGGFSNPT